MNHTFSLTKFKKHLRVAEPMRGEIVAELKTHLDELADGGIFTALGDPKILARRYNRTHIGFWYSEFRISMALIIIGFTSLFGHLIVINELRSLGSWDSSMPLATARDVVGMLGFILPLILSIWFGWNLGKMHKPASVFWRVTLLGFLIVFPVTVLDSLDYEMFRPLMPDSTISIMSVLSGSLIFSLVKLIPFIIIASLCSILASPAIGRTWSSKKSFIKFQALIVFLFIVLSYGFGLLISESFNYARTLGKMVSYLPVILPTTLTLFFGLRLLRSFRAAKVV